MGDSPFTALGQLNTVPATEPACVTRNPVQNEGSLIPSEWHKISKMQALRNPAWLV